MRTFAEYFFRARQETSNLYLLVAQPSFRKDVPGRLPLPDGNRVAAALRGTPPAAQIIDLAENVLNGRYSILGVELDIVRDVHWRRDYRHGRESGLAYLKRVPYLDFAAVGDHKFVWELNRHQHLVLLAQAALLTNDARYIDEIGRQVESWFEQNPFQRGINWTSALEVAFRALSWLWVLHLVGDHLAPRLRVALINGLYQHARHLSSNLSVYFSPNTHLLGEAVALFSIAVAYPGMPGSAAWRANSQRIIEAQLAFQVRGDGSHFEQSTYYHVYALDFFLWFFLISGRPAAFRETLAKMADYLFWILGPNRRIPFMGDDDGGRFFHPYGPRDEFGRGTLALYSLLCDRPDYGVEPDDAAPLAAWWLGPEALAPRPEKPPTPTGCRSFSDSGSVFLQNEQLFIRFDAGPFGFGGAGHSHADSLSFTLENRDGSILVDPGTYSYIGDPEERKWFRGTSAHNTVSIDGQDQALASTPFRWGMKPQVRLVDWGHNPTAAWLLAECAYIDFRHTRKLLLRGGTLLILDEITGPPGQHSVWQWWHWGTHRLPLSSSTPDIQTVYSRLSKAYGASQTSLATVVVTSGLFPLKIATLLGTAGRPISLEEAECAFSELRLSSAFSDKSG